ncbi:hypothetical protein EVAR_4044_1 [Eumeta japonica]|uniref:Uncharacterized protein n=1 Tax=Eumeta variegata TaxID=151549 RepID=A0A4C1T434_EUMVA|nr:hypothetical protein EVAR_4044_1 [Eumeta japonica]
MAILHAYFPHSIDISWYNNQSRATFFQFFRDHRPSTIKLTTSKYTVVFNGSSSPKVERGERLLLFERAGAAGGGRRRRPAVGWSGGACGERLSIAYALRPAHPSPRATSVDRVSWRRPRRSRATLASISHGNLTTFDHKRLHFRVPPGRPAMTAPGLRKRSTEGPGRASRGSPEGARAALPLPQIDDDEPIFTELIALITHHYVIVIGRE